MRLAFALAIALCVVVALTGCGGGTTSTPPTTGAPVANAGGPYTGTVGIQVVFNGGGSYDPRNGQAITVYAWDFGDGKTGTGIQPTHTYSAAGTFNVSLTITDSSNQMSTATTTTTIAAPSAPVANAGGPYTGMVGVASTFDGGGSSDPQGEALTYAWNFGDGAMGTGVSPTHVYSTPAAFKVSLTVTNSSALTSTATTTATIAAVPPVANAGGPYMGAVGSAVALTGAGSTDPQGETLTYAWNFGDTTTGVGLNPTHIYSMPGTFKVSLTVTNTSGLTAAATSTANIAAAPPTANAGGPYTGIIGSAVTFSGGGSSDPQSETLTYAWSFGDGGTGVGVNPSHTYSTAQTYSVSLTVTNTSGLSSSATSKATITSAPQAPTANAGGPYTGSAGVAVIFNGGGSSDPQGETLTYAWKFGDGGTGTGVSPSHTYSAAGTWYVSLAVTDTSNLSATASSYVVVAPALQPPVANAGGPYTGVVGQSIPFYGNASSDPQGQTLTYAWTFGDGGTGTGVFPTHAYSKVGTYTVSLTVTDTSKLTGTATSKATITAAAPPVAGAGGPYSGSVGAPVSFNGDYSSDPQGEPLTYAWKFGDGGTGTGEAPTHTYSVADSYTVSLTVTNAANLSSTATGSVSIAGNPVANAGGPYTGIPGDPVSFSGSGSTDPLGESLSYAWSFGDGTTGTGVSPMHTYSVAGTYTVSLTVTNTSNLSGTATTTASIPDGSVHGGQLPIVGAHVYLFAASATGYGLPSVSLLNAADTGYSDALGAYVVSGSDGSYFWVGDGSCTPGDQLYVYALAGNTGSGTNLASGLLAVLGNCPSSGNLGEIPYAWANEVSTVAAAYAFAGFATDATHVSSSGTALAKAGIANAFANAANLAALSSGTALATTPTGTGVVPQSKINTLANVLANCVNSGASCNTLFSAATSDGLPLGVKPTDTATAAINVAHNPAANITALYELQTSSSPFAPALTAQPNDFTVALTFGGYVTGGAVDAPYSIAIDGSNNAWVPNYYGGSVAVISSSGANLSVFSVPGGGARDIAIDNSGNAWITNGCATLAYCTSYTSVTELSSSGAVLSGTNGYTGGGLNLPWGIAIDGSGDAWATNEQGNTVTELSNSGTILSDSGGGAYQAGGLNAPQAIAIDSSGNAWISSYGGDSVVKLSNLGSVLSGANGFTGGGLGSSQGIAIDSSGNAWVANAGGSSVVKLSNSGSILSGANGFTGGGLAGGPYAIAIDGSGNAWVANFGGNTLTELSNSGSLLSGSNGYTGSLGYPVGVAIDGSGDVWVANQFVAADNLPNGGDSTVTEFIGAGTPVVTPLAAGVTNNTLGTRP